MSNNNSADKTRVLSKMNDPLQLEKSRLNDWQVHFLRTEIASGFVFVAVAHKKYEMQDRASAKLSILHAEQAYDTVDVCFFTHKQGMEREEIEEFTEGLYSLREKIDEGKRRFVLETITDGYGSW